MVNRLRPRRLKAGAYTIVLMLLPAVNAFGTDLRITDSANNVFLVHDAVMDYSTFSKDRETEGIRVIQGDATIVAKWANITSATVSELRIEIVMKNGKKETGMLVKKGKMKLTGRTDLGDYSIDIDKIRSISPVP
jgi:hypothetical protein